MHRPALPARFFLLLALSLGTAVSLPALEFRVLSWQGMIDGLFIRDGAKSLPLSGFEQSLSAPVQISPSENLDIFRMVEIEGRQQPQRIASLPIPEGLTRAILVLMTENGSVGGVWIDDRRANFPPGSFALHNLSSQSIAIKVDDTSHMLAPRSSWNRAFIRNARSSQILSAIPEGESVRFIVNSRLRVHPDYRILYFFRDGRPLFVNGPIDEPIEFVMIYDYKKPSEKDEEEVFTLPTT